MASQKKLEVKTFSNQHRLPRLPVPSLEETISKYLKSLRPLLSDADFARNESYAKDFLKPNGLGRLLQQRLLDVDRITSHNWLDDFWWIKKAYQEWRVSVAVNSNWYFLFIDDRNTPHEYFTVNNGIRSKGKFSDFQVKRAAHLIGKMLEYKDLLDSERIPPEATRTYPLCMNQYTRLYGYTRIPQHDCDALSFTPHPATSRHVLVMVRDQFYILEGYDKDGIRLSDGDYEKQLQDIISDVERAQLDPPVGVLTADDRDSWTVARERLLAISPQNRETLNLVENALFVINLDDYATGMDLDKWVCNVFYGLNCHNRWFDKSMSIVVESNGRAGMNGEHSPCDALIPSFISNYIVQEPTSLNAQLSGRSIPPPLRIRFVTNEQTLSDIVNAEARIEKLVSDSDITILQFPEYGAHCVKVVGKCSPDAYIQMALQLAYFQLHGKVVPTYETASTRQFLNGRTETIRTLSVDSKAFVEGMLNKSLNAKQKYDLLQSAAKAHSVYTRESSNGKGCDRHMLGLRLLLQKGESHPIFEDPAYAKSQEWLLSTSGLNTGEYLNGTGFGCVYPNGYGINYLPGEHLFKFGIESKHSSPETNTKEFKQSLLKALRDMKSVCEEVNGKYTRPSKL